MRRVRRSGGASSSQRCAIGAEISAVISARHSRRADLGRAPRRASTFTTPASSFTSGRGNALTPTCARRPSPSPSATSRVTSGPRRCPSRSTWRGGSRLHSSRCFRPTIQRPMAAAAVSCKESVRREVVIHPSPAHPRADHSCSHESPVSTATHGHATRLLLALTTRLLYIQYACTTERA